MPGIIKYYCNDHLLLFIPFDILYKAPRFLDLSSQKRNLFHPQFLSFCILRVKKILGEFHISILDVDFDEWTKIRDHDLLWEVWYPLLFTWCVLVGQDFLIHSFSCWSHIHGWPISITLPHFAFQTPLFLQPPSAHPHQDAWKTSHTQHVQRATYHLIPSLYTPLNSLSKWMVSVIFYSCSIL